MATTTTTATSSPSRYDILMTLIEKGMIRSRQSLNSTELVKASYGEDDAAAFGGTEMLAGTMDDMLDKLHEQVLGLDLPAYLEEHQIQALLDKFDNIVQTLDREEAAQAQAELQDQESAIRAKDSILLPAGLTLKQIMEYHKYQHALAQKDKLTRALQQVQEEIETLETVQVDLKGDVESKQRVLQHTARELSRSADICSMVVSS